MPPTPTDDLQQREHLQKLWDSFERPIVDESTPVSKKASIPGPAAAFVVRLHRFFTTFLQHAQNDEPSNVYTKSLSQSCLQSWALSVLKRRIRRNDNSNSTVPVRVRLYSGRRVVPLHHEEFLNELNHFELQGKDPTPDFIRRESFGAFLYHLPSIALATIGCAMALSLVTLSVEDAIDDATRNQFLTSTQIIVRFVHVRPVLPMRDVKTGLVGKFVSIQGHIVKARPKRLRVATAEFICQSCAGLVSHAFEGGQYSVPHKCTATPNCKARTFTMVRPTARYINVQTLRLQESQDESVTQAGRTPRQLQVELTHDDLVEVCRPGDMVLVVATIAAVNTAVMTGQRGKRAQESSTYQLYLKGHSVTTLSESSAAAGSASSSGSNTQVVYTQQQLQSITQLCHADHRYFGLVERRAFPFDLLVRSLCPAIIGHDEVKAGLLLCLLGGTPPSEVKGHSIRSNAHILIVGDPGMGKSQMLLAASQLAARSVYVGGNTSSTTGLTVTLTKEEGGESGIEAGALVLADQGVCCIDEFDKMAKNHQDGLLEAMEQQQVSIAKAGVVASLPARCSLVAAANPRHGNYNMDKTVAENLNMAKPILSRFDLVFILRDRANSDLDRLVSSNIMNLYRNNKDVGNSKNVPANLSQTTTTTTADNDDEQPNSSGNDTDNKKEKMPLLKRLEWVNSFQKQPLPAELVRDYIAYARQYCKPKLTSEAAKILKEYYMNLRYPDDGLRRRETVPITTRQLEALIRLCQARAKACLRDFVLQEDALDVVELMSLSVEQVHSDESGLVDPIRGGAGGKSNRKIKKAFLCEIQRLVGVGGECDLDDLRRIADQVRLGLSEFHNMIDDFRDGGVLMRKADGRYQVLM